MPEQENDVGHGVRAMAFWHKDGLGARRALASAFGGPNGRIATVRDLVDARLATGPEEYPWNNSFDSDTRVYVGLDGSGRLRAVVRQGTGPEPTQIGMLSSSGITGPWGRPAVRRRDFVAMLAGDSAPGQTVLDLEEYAAFVAEARYGVNNWDARLSAEQAARDPMLLAIFGDRLGPYMTRITAEARAWLGTHDVFPLDYHDVAAFTRLDPLRKELNAPDASGAAFVFRIGFHRIMRCEKREVPPVGPRDYRCMLRVQYDDFVDEQFHGYHAVVGVRPGSRPITGIALPLDVLREDAFREWRTFAGPIVPDAPVAESDIRLREIMEWEGTFFAIAERVCRDGRVPGARAVTVTEIPVDLPIRAPVKALRKDSWTGNTREAIESNAPDGANAYIEDSAVWIRAGEGYSHIDVRVRYFRVEFDETPMHFLMRVGDSLFTQYPHSDTERPRGSMQPRALASSVEQIGRAMRLRLPSNESLQEDAWLYVTALRAQAPAGANAVLLDGNGWYGEAQFFRVVIDHAFGWPNWNDMRANVHGTARRLESLGLI